MDEARCFGRLFSLSIGVVQGALVFPVGLCLVEDLNLLESRLDPPGVG